MNRNRRPSLRDIAEARLKEHQREKAKNSPSDNDSFIEGRVIWTQHGAQAIRVEKEQRIYIVDKNAAFLAQDKDGIWRLLKAEWGSPSSLCLEFPDGTLVEDDTVVRIPFEKSMTRYEAMPPLSGPQWWQVLGVPKAASLELARSAFRRLAKEHHPDTGKDASTTMYELNHAMREAETDFLNRYTLRNKK